MLVSLAVYGCESARYYSQAIQGQVRILQARRPISEILTDPESPAFLRERLTHILAVRQFAENELKLPAKNHYLTYVDLKRPYVVWNVVAAPEFSLAPKTWCYPVVGCAAYRGYFDAGQLAAYAGELRQQRFDTYIASVPAYSTLGWFDDPVLNTVLDWPEPQLAGLIFHELSHQQLYIDGDTVFNESFATAVERVGVERWLQAQGDERSVSRWREYWQQRTEVVELIAQTREDLQELYSQDMPVETTRARKQQRLDASRAAYRRLRNRWAQDPGYDEWFSGELNNAKLGAAQAYHQHVAAFLALLDTLRGDLRAFYQRAAAIGSLAPRQRERCLQGYLHGGQVDCPV